MPLHEALLSYVLGEQPFPSLIPTEHLREIAARCAEPLAKRLVPLREERNVEDVCKTGSWSEADPSQQMLHRLNVLAVRPHTDAAQALLQSPQDLLDERVPIRRIEHLLPRPQHLKGGAILRLPTLQAGRQLEPDGRPQPLYSAAQHRKPWMHPEVGRHPVYSWI